MSKDKPKYLNRFINIKVSSIEPSNYGKISLNSFLVIAKELDLQNLNQKEYLLLKEDSHP